MRPILDFHTHAYPEEIAGKAVRFLNSYYKVECAGDGTIDDLKASAKEAGVGWLLIHAVATKPSQVENVNTWIAAHTSKNVIGFGSLHPYYKKIGQEIERIESLGLRGIKLHPDFQGYYVDSPEMEKIYSLIEGKLPVLIHTGDRKYDFSSPRRIANVLHRHPGLTVIAAHLGGFCQWEQSMKYLIGKNLYIDTSSSACYMEPERALSMIRAHGVDKVLFGTDYPLRRHSDELKTIEGLGLTEAEKSLIYFENAKKLLRL